MSDRTTTRHRGLLTHDPRFSAAALAADGEYGADYTQAGPIPGRPVAASGTTAALEASGSQGTRTVEVLTTRGGIPGAAVPLLDTELTVGPTLGWRYAGDTNWRGTDPPDTISEWEYLDRVASSTQWLHPHAVSRADGSAFIVAQKAQQYVTIWRRTLSGAWTEIANVYDAFSAVYTSVGAHPCLVPLPGNRLLCPFVWINSTGVGLSSSYSLDAGATWTAPQIADLVIESLIALGGQPSKIRAAYSNGQILALVYMPSGAGADYVIQLASRDEGASFELVAPVGDNNAGYAEVVAAPGGGFVVITVDTDLDSTGAVCPAYARRVGSAYDVVMAAPRVLIQSDADTVRWGTRSGGLGTALTAGELAACVDDAGVIWVTGLDYTAGALRQSRVSYSTDGGATWALLDPSGSPGAWWRGGDVAIHPRQLTICAQGGRLMAAHTVNAATATASLAVAYLGGPTTVCQPAGDGGITVPGWQHSFTSTYLPFALPETYALGLWTYAAVGGPTVSLTGQGLRVQHGGVLDSATWTVSPTTTNAKGLLIVADLRAAVGSVHVSARVGEAGPSSYEVRIRVTPTSIILRDLTGAVDILTVSTTAGATGVQVRLAVGDTGGGAATGRVQAWYRAWGSDSDRDWIDAGGSSALVQGASTTARIQSGTVAGSATTDVHVRLLQYAEGTDCGGAPQWDGGNTQNPADLVGMPIGPAPYPVAETGLRLAMRDGPTRRGDSWTITPGYRYPASNIDPSQSPSPAARWRNLADGVSQRLVFVLPEATPMESPLAGLHLEGNIATATWDGWDGAAWVTIAAVDLRLGTALKYTRAGEIVYCGTGGGSAIADYVERGALRGCTFVTGGGTVRRRIKRNSGGRWTGAAVSTTRPILTLDAPDAGDPTAASDAEIVSPRVTCVWRGATTGYSRYSLHIPAQSTAEGYYEIGVLMPGPVAVLGSPDWGRQLATATNVETTETRAGSQTRRRMGTPPRSATVSWTDGWDTSNSHDAAPDYVTDYVGGWPIATPAAIASDVHAILYDNDATPVVYLPVIPVPVSSATVTNIVAADLLLYGHVDTDTIQTDVVLGTEHTGTGAGELVRVGSVRVRECL